jgi:HK97 family phage prohead protease
MTTLRDFSHLLRKEAPISAETKQISMGLTEVKLLSASSGTFSGYGSIFGNVDAHGDVMAKGCYARSLKEWRDQGKWPKMLLQHGGWGMTSDDMLPVGQWTNMEENDRGLKVEGRLFALNTERGQYIYEGLKSGELDGLSVGFIPRELREGTKPNEPRRTFTDVDLKEVSIVLFGANDKARISSVKSLTTDDIREIEAILRTKDLSRADAAKAISGFKDWLQRDAAAPISAPRDEVVPETAEAIAAAAEVAAKFAVGGLRF